MPRLAALATRQVRRDKEKASIGWQLGRLKGEVTADGCRSTNARTREEERRAWEMGGLYKAFFSFFIFNPERWNLRGSGSAAAAEEGTAASQMLNN